MIRWEELPSEGGPYKRAKVNNGWVILTGYRAGDPGRVTFLSDPSHEWDGALVELK